MDYNKIAENHIRARRNKSFDPADYSSPEDWGSKIESGNTYEVILQRIEDTMINPFDVYDAHNGVISPHYEEAVKVGFLLFTNKLKSWQQKWQKDNM